MKSPLSTQYYLILIYWFALQINFFSLRHTNTRNLRQKWNLRYWFDTILF